jgi:hypothetical protein
LGGPCAVANPWPQPTNAVFRIDTKPGQTYALRPAHVPLAASPIAVMRNTGPKWPVREGTNDTAEAYLERTAKFGMLGICRDGGNPARNVLAPAQHPEAFAGRKPFGLSPTNEPPVQISFEDQQTGRWMNGAAQAPGKVGQALKLSGTAYLEVPHSPSVSFRGALTIEAWVYPQSTGQRVVDKSTAGRADSYDLDLFPDNHVRFITPAATLITSNAIPTNAWTHLAATYDANTGVQRIYINGQLQAEQRELSAAKDANTNPLRIGAASNGGENFQGLIDEVSIYQRILTPGEIRTHFQNVNNH